MKILNKEEFMAMPDGTVYMMDRPGAGCDNGITIKVSKNSSNNGKIHWYNRLDLSPFIKENTDDSSSLYTQWSTWHVPDDCYNDNDVFYVFSNTEVMQLINCLSWALTGCKAQFNMDHWYCGDNFIPLHDDEMDD